MTYKFNISFELFNGWEEAPDPVMVEREDLLRLRRKFSTASVQLRDYVTTARSQDESLHRDGMIFRTVVKGNFVIVHGVKRVFRLFASPPRRSRIAAVARSPGL